MRPTMFGYILHYSVQTGEGAISADDGTRYSFAGRDWLAHEPPTRGDRVEFAVLDGRATSVSVTVPAHRRNQGQQHGFALLAVVAGLAAGLAAGTVIFFVVTLLLIVIPGSFGVGRIEIFAILLLVAPIAAIAVGYSVYRVVRNRRRR